MDTIKEFHMISQEFKEKYNLSYEEMNKIKRVCKIFKGKVSKIRRKDAPVR